MFDQQQKDSYKETPEPAFAGTGVSLSTDLFYSPSFFIFPATPLLQDQSAIAFDISFFVSKQESGIH